jgi:hypothetical protein
MNIIDRLKAWLKGIDWKREAAILVFVGLGVAFAKDVWGVLFLGLACAVTRWILGKV